MFWLFFSNLIKIYYSNIKEFGKYFVFFMENIYKVYIFKILLICKEGFLNKKWILVYYYKRDIINKILILV